MRTFVVYLLVCGGLLWAKASFAQAAAAEGTAVCTFADGKEVSLHYLQEPADQHPEPPLGKLWMPGGSAMTLFTETPLVLGNTEIPTGAYTVYLVPDKREWIVIVSRNVKVENPYDEKQDLARATMQVGTLDQAVPNLSLYFAHLAPKQCNIRVDYGRTRAWVDFHEK